MFQVESVNLLRFAFDSAFNQDRVVNRSALCSGECGFADESCIFRTGKRGDREKSQRIFFDALAPARARDIVSLRSPCKIDFTVFSVSFSPFASVNTSARPFLTKPLASLFGVKLTFISGQYAPESTQWQSISS